jgi:SAM-dependent methyltransferase
MLPETTKSSVFWEHVYRYAFACRHVKGLNVLDIASGEGYGTNALAQVAKSIVGVDISQEAIEHAIRRYHLDFRVGGAESIPVADCSIDAAVSFETIEHVSVPENLVIELFRVIRPEGMLIISTPNKHLSQHEVISNPFHCSELTISEFTALLNPWFEIKDISGQGFPCIALDRFQKTLGSISNRVAFWLRLKIQSAIIQNSLPFYDDGSSSCRQHIIESIPLLPVSTSNKWNPYAIQPINNSEKGEPAYFVAIVKRRLARLAG